MFDVAEPTTGDNGGLTNKFGPKWHYAMTYQMPNATQRSHHQADTQLLFGRHPVVSGLSYKCCAIYGAIIVQRSVTVSSASARKGKGEGKGKGRIEKGEVNEGKERRERHPRRGKGDIKEWIAKEKGREGERERERERDRI